MARKGREATQACLDGLEIPVSGVWMDCQEKKEIQVRRVSQDFLELSASLELLDYQDCRV